MVQKRRDQSETADIFEVEIFAGEAKVKFRRIKFSKIVNFEENGTYDQLCSEQEEMVRGYHVY